MPEYTFDEEKHVHMLDGKKIKGCTTILDVIAKPALIGWAAGQVVEYIKTNCKEIDQFVYEVTDEDLKNAKVAHRKKKEKAADWGTIVHKAIEMWMKMGVIPTSVTAKGGSFILLEEHLVAVNNFVTWATENKVEFLVSEKGIYSEEWQIGGIVDFVCKIDGKTFVGDVKTSSGIYESYFLQTSAYAKMLMEMGLYNQFEGMIIVNCKKDGSISVEERKDVAGNIKCFEAAITLHNRLN